MPVGHFEEEVTTGTDGQYDFLSASVHVRRVQLQPPEHHVVQHAVADRFSVATIMATKNIANLVHIFLPTKGVVGSKKFTSIDQLKSLMNICCLQ